MDRYLGQLEARLAPRSLRVMQSNGGCLTAASARRQAARTVLSGPAGGAVGALAVAREALGAAGDAGPNIITFDMGGTSTDVCLCPGQLPFTSEGEIAALGLPLRLPIIDIHTVGAGGGSLARLDLGGALAVGPQSAGADPGPACYGRGGRASTVTDANLVLNRLHAEHFLGGQLRLDTAAALAALGPLAERLGGAPAAAWGIVQVANAAMERAIRKISVERGFDPAAFTLWLLAAPALCTPASWPPGSPYRACWCRAPPACSPPWACWPPTWCAIFQPPRCGRWPAYPAPIWPRCLRPGKPAPWPKSRPRPPRPAP